MLYVVAAVGAAAGCYAELGTAYLPSVTQTITSPMTHEETTTDTTGWSVSFKVGVYLDVPLAFARTGIGIGAAPSGASSDAVFAGDAPVSSTGIGDAFRGDITLPFVPFSSQPQLRTRLTAVRTSFDGVKLRPDGQSDYDDIDGANGTSWFVGPSLGVPGSLFGTSIMASLGYYHTSCALPVDDGLGRDGVSTRGSGVGLRVMVGWTPTGQWLRHYQPSSPGAAPTGGGCHYETQCDVDGRCRTQYVCP